MNTQAEIKTLFDLQSPNDASIVTELSSLCSLYSLTPDNLKFKWEAFALNSGCPLKPSSAYIKYLKNSLQREFERSLKARRTVKGRVVTKRSTGMDLSEYGIKTESQNDTVEDFMSHMLQGTPKQTKVVPLTPSTSVNDTQLSKASSHFLTRPASHIIETQYNENLPRRPTNEHEPIQLDHLRPPIKSYRYMFEKIREKADNLDERIEYIGSIIAEHAGIEAYGNPTTPGQASIWAYGRICSDSSDQSRLNDASVTLQTSRDSGMGRRVRLNLAKVEAYSLFPGQIIAVKGSNRTGDVFHVEEIKLPPLPKTWPSLQLKGTKPLEMITASGPFTLDDDFSFQPLEELLNHCKEQQPDVLVLMGPFISCRHPRVTSGKMESFPDEIFAEQVVKRLTEFLEHCKKTQVLLMPHMDDMITVYPLFPQPPLDPIKHERIHQLSNPSTISINGHSIAFGNMDVLFRLAKEEITKSVTHTDRFTKLIQHVLQQHTFYPLFPYAQGDCIEAKCMVDLQLPYTPELLVLPSQFKHFTKNVEGSICVNPGHLCKNASGGSYARIILYPTTNVNERVRVDLVKL